MVFINKKVKKLKDAEKEKKFKESGIRILRIVERYNRNGSIEYLEDIIKIPEMTTSKFEDLKDILIQVCEYWGLISRTGIPEKFFNITLDEARSFTSKPIYEKSLKYYLDNHDSVFWDYDKITA